jgi:hypothetical protein
LYFNTAAARASLIAVFAAISAGTLCGTSIDFGTDPVTFSASGSFVHDNDEQDFTFALSQESSVDIDTTSWGGPDNGFAPYLTLFYGDGTATGVSDGGNYNPSLDVDLQPGSYLVVLTEYSNIPLGNLSDGFAFDPTNSPCSIANFTGADCLGYGTDDSAFWDSGNIQHTGLWDISGTDTPVVAPEPSMALPLCLALAALTRARRSGSGWRR